MVLSRGLMVVSRASLALSALSSQNIGGCKLIVGVGREDMRHELLGFKVRSDKLGGL